MFSIRRFFVFYTLFISFYSINQHIQAASQRYELARQVDERQVDERFEKLEEFRQILIETANNISKCIDLKTAERAYKFKREFSITKDALKIIKSTIFSYRQQLEFKLFEAKKRIDHLLECDSCLKIFFLTYIGKLKITDIPKSDIAIESNNWICCELNNSPITYKRTSHFLSNLCPTVTPISQNQQIIFRILDAIQQKNKSFFNSCNQDGSLMYEYRTICSVENSGQQLYLSSLCENEKSKSQVSDKLCACYEKTILQHAGKENPKWRLSALLIFFGDIRFDMLF